MPPKAKYALSSMEAANEHLVGKFGPEDTEALLVAADCGATVAIVMGRMLILEPLLFSLSDAVQLEKARTYSTSLEKDSRGRSQKVRIDFIPLFSHLFSNPRTPRPEVRARLEGLAPSFSNFADLASIFDLLRSAAAQLRAFYAQFPDREDLFRQLKNPKALMTFYVLQEAKSLGVVDQMTSTDLAALGILVDIEEPSKSTKAMGDKWQEVRKAAELAGQRLAKLPTIEFSHKTISLRVELPRTTQRPFVRVLAGIGG